MEGDLLEVTMDEVQQLWQLLQLDTEYVSAFDTSPAKVGGRANATTNNKQEVTCQCQYVLHKKFKVYFQQTLSCVKIVSPESSGDSVVHLSLSLLHSPELRWARGETAEGKEEKRGLSMFL